MLILFVDLELEDLRFNLTSKTHHIFLFFFLPILVFAIKEKKRDLTTLMGASLLYNGATTWQFLRDEID